MWKEKEPHRVNEIRIYLLYIKKTKDLEIKREKNLIKNQIFKVES